MRPPSDDHGWSSVTGAKDGGRGPWHMGGSSHPLAMDGKSVPVAKDGEKGHCSLPRIWGRELERKFAILLT
ncbi:MAG TPA: hypothetical protein VN456_01135 [Desulfosporosinus sp.]|nr:hypothetical protein [Desulfosporosinus sp.]